jgi:hypothetical protein
MDRLVKQWTLKTLAAAAAALAPDLLLVVRERHRFSLGRNQVTNHRALLAGRQIKLVEARPTRRSKFRVEIRHGETEQPQRIFEAPTAQAGVVGFDRPHEDFRSARSAR